MMMIMKNPPPKIKSKGWSNEVISSFKIIYIEKLIDFHSKCLVKNPAKRWNVK